MAAGLVNVLADGENTYFYGNTVLAQVSDTQTGYYLPDVLGSVRQMTSPTGEVQLSQRFTPFGEVKEKYGDGEANFGYTGQKFDAQTGLLYLRARYYSPGSGRFISKDTWDGYIYNPITLNKYVYANSAPLNYVDFSGFCSQNGWDEHTGLFTEEQCNKLENAYLALTKVNGTKSPKATATIESWYYELVAKIEQDGYKQTAINLRHYLEGTGTDIKLSQDFMQKEIWNWEALQNDITTITKRYVRFNLGCSENNQTFDIKSTVLAKGININNLLRPSRYHNPSNWPSYDVHGSLGNFRIDVVVGGTIDRTPNINTIANLQLHIVVMDQYNWERDRSAYYPPKVFGGNEIPDDWAKILGKPSFKVRGDYDVSINLNEIMIPSISEKTMYGMDGWTFKEKIGQDFLEVGGSGPEPS